METETKSEWDIGIFSPFFFITAGGVFDALNWCMLVC